MKDYILGICMFMGLVVLAFVFIFIFTIIDRNSKKCFLDTNGYSYETTKEFDYGYIGFKYEATKVDKNTPKMEGYFYKDNVEQLRRDGYFFQVDCDFLYRTEDFKEFE